MNLKIVFGELCERNLMPSNLLSAITRHNWQFGEKCEGEI